MQDTKKIQFEDWGEAIYQISQRLSNIEQLLTQRSENTSQDQLLSIEEASAFLMLSRATLYSKVSRKELPFIKKTKRLYFSKDELVKYLKTT
jgi:excisionase family DNA binding protein